MFCRKTIKILFLFIDQICLKVRTLLRNKNTQKFIFPDKSNFHITFPSVRHQSFFEPDDYLNCSHFKKINLIAQHIKVLHHG